MSRVFIHRAAVPTPSAAPAAPRRPASVDATRVARSMARMVKDPVSLTYTALVDALKTAPRGSMNVDAPSGPSAANASIPLPPSAVALPLLRFSKRTRPPACSATRMALSPRS